MNEETFYEGGPAKSDLIINLLAGITILGLPFTFAAIVRALWLRYKITNKRISIDGGWFGRNKIRRMLQEWLLTNIQRINNHKPYWLLVNLKNEVFCNDKNKLLEEFQNLMFKSRLIK